MFVRAENSDNIVTDVDASVPIEIFEHEVRNRNGAPVGQRRLVYAGRQLENGRSVLDYHIVEESTMFRLLAAYSLPWRRSSRMARVDSECSDDNQHSVWNTLLVGQGPELVEGRRRKVKWISIVWQCGKWCGRRICRDRCQLVRWP